MARLSIGRPRRACRREATSSEPLRQKMPTGYKRMATIASVWAEAYSAELQSRLTSATSTLTPFSNL